MTISKLSALGMMLERARILLEGQEGREAEDLRHDVRNAISGIRWLEADQTLERWHAHAAELAERGRDLYERTRSFADARRLRFLQIDSPCPERSDTLVMSAAEVRAAIDAMPPEADAPPPSVLAVIVDAQQPDGPPSSIPPSAPTGRFPISE